MNAKCLLSFFLFRVAVNSYLRTIYVACGFYFIKENYDIGRCTSVLLCIGENLKKKQKNKKDTFKFAVTSLRILLR